MMLRLTLLSLKSAVNYSHYVSQVTLKQGHVTDVIDSVSLLTKFSKIDYIDPFKSENFNISVTIEGNNFRAFLDTGAAATAVSAKVWDV